MNKITLAAAAIFLALPLLAQAKDGTVTAAVGWNNSAGFQTSYDISSKAAIADLIEKKENGYYDQWKRPINYNTYIGAQVTTIGAQTIFQDSNLDNVIVTTTNCGEVVSATSVKSADSNQINVTGSGCNVTTNNMSNPNEYYPY
ncbi:MAG: hypothetical protein CMN55_13180 [Sneathiella sp.]|jgi:hypothetical protein|uniref:hypothetical protein n=1 Tax=Sneathiella sp. TaxID=1964365 RepID=UPI000C4FEA7D|nr:hypothetical protein [Sneathiella sp.]MAL80042.1 hypothetical protein [Sneathiella sp.]|tara:strand:- start:570 stop:1001 length:432 start_codon:yes stop_codon:yes gene_type:complete